MTTAQIVTTVISILSLLGLGTVAAFFWTDKHEKAKNKTAEAKKKAKEERQNETREVLEEALKPIMQSNLEMQKDLLLIKKGEQANLRHNLYEIYDKYIVLGYCPSEEKVDFENLYQNYHSLGKNGVMDANREKLLALPDSLPVSKKKKTTNNTKGGK